MTLSALIFIQSVEATTLRAGLNHMSGQVWSPGHSLETPGLVCLFSLICWAIYRGIFLLLIFNNFLLFK